MTTRPRTARAVLVANLGHGRPPNGQTLKARELRGLLERAGLCESVIDVGSGLVRIVRVASLARRGVPTVLVLNRRGLWVALALVRLGRWSSRTRAPVIVPVVGGWLPDYVARRAFRWLARGADVYLAETPRVVSGLRSHGLEARELANFRRTSPIPVVRPDGPRDPLRLCFAGRVRGDKGVVAAAELVGRLGQLGIRSRLDIYGPVEDPDALRAAVALEGVEHRGTYDTTEEALRILGEQDLLVLPSSYFGECMPGVVVEAGLVGLPCVVSDWKDLPTVVEDGVTGIVCPLEGFSEIAARRIAACLSEGTLGDLSRAALAHATMAYSEEAALATMASALRGERAG